MKSKKASKIARGRMAKALVFRGLKEKTVGGLTSSMLMKNKRGKIVSKRANASGKRSFKNIEGWVDACMAARKDLKMSGFVAVNGKSVQGKALYVKAKATVSARRGASMVPVAAPVAAETAVEA